MSILANLGYPRIGRQRELKFALEKYWAGKSSVSELQTTAKSIRLGNWLLQKELGVQSIPSNDFSLYDQVLDTSWMVGAIPRRFEELEERCLEMDLYFALARGWQNNGIQVAAMEMTKWFDTNYHYIVPEISDEQSFTVNESKILSEFMEARDVGILTRPVLLGPVSFLLLSKPSIQGNRPISVLGHLLPVYSKVLQHLAAAGAKWVQIDEPCLVLELDKETKRAYRMTYEKLECVNGINILLATYFGGIGDNLALVSNLPVEGLHVDLVRAPQELDAVLKTQPVERIISLGLVDGRNVWRTNLESAVLLAKRAAEMHRRDALQIAPSCSLLHCPQDLDLEIDLDVDVKKWLAFAKQKLRELALITSIINGDSRIEETAISNSNRFWIERRSSTRVNNPQVQQRLHQIRQSDYNRKNEFNYRKAIQVRHFKLPLLPTTTIGSFPQTAEVRMQRAHFNQGKIDLNLYNGFLKDQIRQAIKMQEDLGLDVLVHGEFERTDMVEYFAERLEGFVFTRHGWVQSYGSRAVRPPVLYGDVSRPRQMTLEWIKYAQSLTKKPVKGMLTGPVTILQWSFVRDDQSRESTCKQIALALRDEIKDLEAAGIKMIQMDEPALREGLPLRRSAWKEYLDWAVDCFRLAVGAVNDETQIHTHMCYGEFNDIIEAISRMDADVISIEASRSKMELLDAFTKGAYPNDFGPGIYDIHSPRVPSQEEMAQLLDKALKIIFPECLWVNPDCGLKTRTWAEVIPSLQNMVAAAKQIRERLEESITR